MTSHRTGALSGGRGTQARATARSAAVRVTACSGTAGLSSPRPSASGGTGASGNSTTVGRVCRAARCAAYCSASVEALTTVTGAAEDSRKAVARCSASGLGGSSVAMIQEVTVASAGRGDAVMAGRVRRARRERRTE
ncbi:hypothetical protein ABZ769_23340 [Streptomyces olivoreticuli]